MHIEELNAFFLKHLLWVPPECKLNRQNTHASSHADVSTHTSI